MFILGLIVGIPACLSRRRRVPAPAQGQRCDTLHLWNADGVQNKNPVFILMGDRGSSREQNRMNDKGRAPVLADLHIRSCDVKDVLAGLMVIRGAPGEIWPDNGPNAWILTFVSQIRCGGLSFPQ